MSAQPVPYVTPEDYLAFDRQHQEKNEYLDGHIYALAGGSQRHNVIVANIVAGIHGQLRRRTCSVYPSDMRIHVPGTNFYAYPDMSVACEPIQLTDSYQDTLINPVVIIEVLSKSTENYDRGRKFRMYRHLQSLQEYLLVAQHAVHIEHYTRQPDRQWLFVDIDDLSAIITLESIQCMLAVGDIYEKISLEAEE